MVSTRSCDLSDMFGGGMTSNLGSSGAAEHNLNRTTVILGIVWIASIIALGLTMPSEVLLPGRQKFGVTGLTR
jgi:protein translocase SecG subunit